MDSKERMAIPRQKMPEQDPVKRRYNYNEVTYGFSEETAIKEAQRCLQCKKPKCIEGCPVLIDIPGFILLIEEGRFIEAARKLKEENSLPAVTGRVCPQETQCEIKCVVGKKVEPVSIGRLERFAADYERRSGQIELPKVAHPTGKKVAIIGSGPAGLTVAGDLIKLGHEVIIFEALHEPGGVLMYGIPEFRLPKETVLAEISFLKELGVDLRLDHVIGKAISIDELLKEYDAVFIGTGAGLPMFMGIPGENLIGVYSANEYLTRANLMKAFLFPEYATAPIRSKKVVTVGGGNVAMDAARTAIRLGAESSTIVYRRSRKEMPARIEEIHHAEEEGVVINLLTNPTKIIGNEEGHVVAIECLRMELGEPDESGRRRPVPIKGSEFVIKVDTVIPALGNKPNPLIPQTTPDLKITKWNTIVVDENTMATSKEGVFAGGDIVSGAATVILAMGQGKIAAKSINEYIMKKNK